MKAALIDLDGVVYQDGTVIPGAGLALEWLKKNAIPYLFLTNTTSKPRSAIVANLSSMGLTVTAEEILTPALAAVNYLASNRHEVISLYVPAATRAEFSQFRLAPADAATAVILGDLGFDWNFATLNQAFRILMSNSNVELIALGMTRYWRAEKGLQLDVGPFVQALAYATGKQPIVMGKPSPDFFNMACRKLGMTANQVVMIGDDPYSDIAAAQASGIKGVQVKTGKFRADDLNQTRPDWLIASIAELPSLGATLFEACRTG